MYVVPAFIWGTSVELTNTDGDMDFWQLVLNKWPRLSLYILGVYAVGYSMFIGYEFYRKNTYEAEKPYINGVYEECLDASTIAAKIAVGGSPESVRAFWELYYGKLVIFENKSVTQAMVDFGKVLTERAPVEGMATSDLLKKSLGIAGACRDLIKATWKLSIQPWSSLETQVQTTCPGAKCR